MSSVVVLIRVIKTVTINVFFSDLDFIETSK